MSELKAFVIIFLTIYLIKELWFFLFSITILSKRSRELEISEALLSIKQAELDIKTGRL